MRTSALAILALYGLTGALAGCGSGSSLTTGSLFGGSNSSAPSQVQAPKPVTPSDRAVHVGATVARAQRCGFFFEPDQVRANYLAAEQQAGTPPDVLQKITREFDATRAQLTAVIAKDDGYCTEGRTREVKAALNTQLAGDFNPPRRREDVAVGLFDHQKRDRPFDGNAVFDKSQRPAQPPLGSGY